MTRIIVALLLVLALCGAKATVGADFNDANLPQLQVGVSTPQDAIALLGRGADQTQAGQSGAVGYTWRLVESSASVWTGKAKSSHKSVTLVFSPDGTFQRIFTLQGINLPPADMKRLMTDPAAAVAREKGA